MNFLTPSPHFCTNNQTAPIRATNTEPIHPRLHDVELKLTALYVINSYNVNGKFNSRKTGQNGSDGLRNLLPLLISTSETNSAASESAPADSEVEMECELAKAVKLHKLERSWFHNASAPAGEKGGQS